MAETPSTEEEPKKSKSKGKDGPKVPPAEDPKTPAGNGEEKKPAPKTPAGNAELNFTDHECEISGAPSVVASTSDVRKTKISFKVVVADGTDPLSLGVAGASHELEKAAHLIDEGKNSTSMTVARDFRLQRYVVDPQGSGAGIEFVGEFTGALSVSVSADGKRTASWSVLAKLSREDFDRLLELRNLPCILSTHEIQGAIVDKDAQLKLH